MQTMGVSKDLSLAIDFLEEILNNKDGDAVIETIKKYKKMKSSGDIGLSNFNLE